MSCADTVCGTGGWTGPLPGDPDNNVTLSAVAASGGIDVSWSYPATNPYAVIHTLLYRGITSDFTAAVQQRVVAGNHYFDRIPSTEIRRYYYWIQLVSVNSTVGSVIGPASAIPGNAVQDTLESLTGLIDAGYLAQSLRSEIDRISLLSSDLSAEALTRFTNNEVLAAALAAVQAESGEALAYILDEVTQRTNENEALLTSINALAVGMNGNLAAIAEEKTVRATADEATADSIEVLVGRVDTTAAAIQNEQTLRVSADAAIANSLTTVQTAFGNNLSSVQTNLESKITTVGGKVTDIGALFSTKVQVNGLFGGMGIYNDGTTVQAGFDVDNFWLGRTTSGVKPFIVDNGVVYMDKARIRDADIDTLKIAGNAVTVPVFSSGISLNIAGAGMGTDLYILNASIYMPAGTKIFAIATIKQDYYTAEPLPRPWAAHLNIFRNNQGEPSTVSGYLGAIPGSDIYGSGGISDSISTSGGWVCTVEGEYTIALVWRAVSSIKVQDCGLIVMGAKR